ERWVEQPLAAGTYSVETYFIDTTAEHLILTPPQAYRPQGNWMLEAVAEQDGWMELWQKGDGWQLVFYVPVVAEEILFDSFCVYSQEELVDWEDEATQERWASYTFTGEHRWCYDGYYYTTP